MTWLKHQGAGKVADLRALPPGTYTCKDLADSLGLPMLKAQRLLTELEGTKLFLAATRHRAHTHPVANATYVLSSLRPRCSSGSVPRVLRAVQGSEARCAEERITRPDRCIRRSDAYIRYRGKEHPSSAHSAAYSHCSIYSSMTAT